MPRNIAKCPKCSNNCRYYRSLKIGAATDFYFRCRCGVIFNMEYFAGLDDTKVLCNVDTRCPMCRKAHQAPIMGRFSGEMIPCFSCWDAQNDQKPKNKLGF